MGSGRASDWEIVLWLVATIANSAANRMVVFNLATGNIIGILHSLTCDTGCQGIQFTTVQIEQVATCFCHYSEEFVATQAE